MLARLARSAARLASAVWVISTLCFVMIYALPGDPARMILGQQASADTVRQFRTEAGLDQSLLNQYRIFALRVVRLDFGESLVHRLPVRELIAGRTPASALLATLALAWLLVLAGLLPILLALRLPTWLRHWVKFWGILATVPPYVLAVTALLGFSVGLGWIPILFDTHSAMAWLLASLVLAVYPVSLVVKLLVQELEAIAVTPFVRRAHASGFSSDYVLLVEVLPNALTPALGAMANGMAYFVTGSFFVEIVFGIPGVGNLTYEAVRNKDLSLLQGLCVYFAILISALSLLLEATLNLVNPRLRQPR